VAKSQHIIELNGKKYDALTGKMVSSPSVKPSSLLRPSHTAITNMDGVSKHPARTAVVKPPHMPERSKTLMRSAVKKPVLKRHAIKAVAGTAAATTKKPKPAPERAPEFVKPERILRSFGVPKSSLISKFGKQSGHIKTEVLPVKAAPAHGDKPAAKRASAHAAASRHAAAAPHKAALFDRALQQASAHAQPKTKKPTSTSRLANKLRVRSRTLIFTSGSLVLVAVIGALAYANIPNFAMRIAATRAGIQASLPSYQPAGFSLKGPINYNAGQVSLLYQSNTDKRDFRVTQQASDWNSQALLEHVVTPAKEPYQTLQTNGRTIYIYGGNNAAWVDGGIFYKIEGKANLSSDQLLRIADSL
jgi:hypothetical protein